MTPEQRLKNTRIEVELMNVSLKAETDEDIAESLRSYKGPYKQEVPGYSPLIMNTSDLEQHVANWRKPPRDFCSDLNLCREMELRLEDLGLDFLYAENIAVASQFTGPPLWWYLLHMVSAEARVDAALAALDARQEGETP